MATATTKQKMTTGTLIKWAFTFGLPLIIMLIPVNEVFTVQMKLFFASNFNGDSLLCF